MDVDGAPPSQRRRLQHPASAGPSQEETYPEDGTGSPSHENSYEDDHIAQDYMMCLSQTDNMGCHNTPMANGQEDDVGPRLKHPKSIQDRVHGMITLHGLLVAVMDTAEFQRLDRIRQLGGCFYVYPSATHTRKEHSVGVAHLCGEMARHLQKKQPDLEIDESDILCIELAGLVHDLGHGPFSHMFEEFMKRVDPTRTWEHEEMSGRLLRGLIRENDVPVADYFDRLPGIQCDQQQADYHINFVIKLIEGLKDNDPWPDDIGRPETKRFLFDIVSNKRNGVDVDKMDYLLRDSMAAFGCSSEVPGFDILRIIKSSDVLNNEKRKKGIDGRYPKEVCFQWKNVLEILEIYQLRAKLHRQVYQHRIANVAEAMITDIFVAANEHFRVKGGDGVPMKISEAAHDPTSFVLLTDSILDALDLSPAEGLEKAAKLLARLKKRDFYQAVGDTPVNIETLPLCTNPKCMKGTPLDAKFCPHCGWATASRTGKCKRDIWRSEGVALTATEALNQILAKIEPQAVREEMQDSDALFVKIVDIQVGKKTTWRDPNNILWEVFDPLSNVGFHNPKYEGHEEEGKLKHVRQDMMPQMYLPKATHTRTLWCYLREENPIWRAAATKALDIWKATMNLQCQEGTSNAASPARRQSMSGTPRARASQNSQFSQSQSGPGGSSRLGKARNSLLASFPDRGGDEGENERNNRLSTISEASRGTAPPIPSAETRELGDLE